MSDGLLKLAGFQVLNSTPETANSYRLIFPYPTGWTNPRSFRDILLNLVNDPRPPIPRNYRFILLRRLADAVYHVHLQNLVHKCIRPESILLFEPAPDGSSAFRYPAVIGAAFLTDWQYTRKTEVASQREAYHDWIMAMYQHPERQAAPGSVAESKYNIGHDIYSLGVCLLEIGLRSSFIVYNGNIPNLSKLPRDAKDDWRVANAGASQTVPDARIEQSVFITLAGDPLAYEMGEDKFVGNESRDWDEQGILFIQEIRRQLAEASTMGTGVYNSLT